MLIIGTPGASTAATRSGRMWELIPSEESSAGKERLRHISKHGNSLLRFLLVAAAQAVARVNPEWRRGYIRLAMRRHKGLAKVAMRRRLRGSLVDSWRKTCWFGRCLCSTSSFFW